jgi:histone H3/H4
MKKSVVVESRIRDLIEGMSLSSDFIPALSLKVESLVAESKRRAKENGRKTLQSKDL